MNHSTAILCGGMVFFFFPLLSFGAKEPIARSSAEEHFVIPACEPVSTAELPWQELPRIAPITIEHFRCRGCCHRPPLLLRGIWCMDCSGAHSLPLVDGKEHVYPILLTLLNHLQTQFGKRVIVTSGHRCPKHHAYVEENPHHAASKHLIGAEVAFYVEGMEEEPERVVEVIESFYGEKFARYEGCTDVQEPPWMNREVLVKLYRAEEGRNGDNKHPYPYISVQVRWDREREQQVVFRPELAETLHPVGRWLSSVAFPEPAEVSSSQ